MCSPCVCASVCWCSSFCGGVSTMRSSCGSALASVRVLPSFGHSRIRAFVAAPLVCTRPSVAMAHGCASPLVAASLVVTLSPCSKLSTSRLGSLAPRALAPRAWRRWLSQPCQRVQRRRLPRPGLMQRLRPATLPLVRARQCMGVRLPSPPHSRARQRTIGGLHCIVRVRTIRGATPRAREDDEGHHIVRARE